MSDSTEVTVSKELLKEKEESIYLAKELGKTKFLLAKEKEKSFRLEQSLKEFENNQFELIKLNEDMKFDLQKSIKELKRKEKEVANLKKISSDTELRLKDAQNQLRDKSLKVTQGQGQIKDLKLQMDELKEKYNRLLTSHGEMKEDYNRLKNSRIVKLMENYWLFEGMLKGALKNE